MTDLASRTFDRTFVLDDISIRSGGDGRTVVAYAAVYDSPAEIRDQDGHYQERILPGAFDRAIADASRVQVLYNHGKTIFGTPSDRGSVPIGTPEEIKSDARGLLTVTRYNRTALADDVLESIRNGDIKGQSFRGSFLKSRMTRGNNGGLPTIERAESTLVEYGPSPFPAYTEASVVSVRSEDIVDAINGLTDEQRAELIELLGSHQAPETDLTGQSNAERDDGGETDTEPSESDVSPTTLARTRALQLRRII